MTLDQCQDRLEVIRERQGTLHPTIRVLCDGIAHCGRLVRTDSDPGRRREGRSPFGTLVLETLGMDRRRVTILQIASIGTEGIADWQPDHQPVERPTLVGAD
jgi:hypothetical protein